MGTLATVDVSSAAGLWHRPQQGKPHGGAEALGLKAIRVQPLNHNAACLKLVVAGERQLKWHTNTPLQPPCDSIRYFVCSGYWVPSQQLDLPISHRVLRDVARHYNAASVTCDACRPWSCNRLHCRLSQALVPIPVDVSLLTGFYEFFLPPQLSHLCLRVGNTHQRTPARRLPCPAPLSEEWLSPEHRPPRLGLLPSILSNQAAHRLLQPTSDCKRAHSRRRHCRELRAPPTS